MICIICCALMVEEWTDQGGTLYKCYNCDRKKYMKHESPLRKLNMIELNSSRIVKIVLKTTETNTKAVMLEAIKIAINENCNIELICSNMIYHIDYDDVFNCCKEWQKL
jgi:hypothetical protein